MKKDMREIGTETDKIFCWTTVKKSKQEDKKSE